MTNKLAIWLGGLIVAVVLVDHFWVHFGLPVFLGRKLLAVIEYVSFWR